jgi:hypothetical protein
MNIRKLVAIVAAILINVAVLAWFHSWSTAVLANAARSQHTDQVLVLPTVTVRPSRAQIEMLRRERKPATSRVAPSGDGGIRALVMPFYSFAHADATESV